MEQHMADNRVTIRCMLCCRRYCRTGTVLGEAYIDAGDVYFGRARKIDKRTMERRGLKTRMQTETPTKHEHGFQVPCSSCRRTVTVSLPKLRRDLDAGAEEIAVGAMGDCWPTPGVYVTVS
jgi:hypothetical protein